MGYWNETCMLSNLPITIDTPVAATILVRRERPSNYSYPNALYTPVTPLFFGRYNDYGGIDEIQAPDNLLAALTQDGIFVSERNGTNEDDKPKYKSTKGMLLTDIMYYVARGCAWFKPDSRFSDKYLPLHLVMMHRSLFNIALETAPYKTRGTEALEQMRRPVYLAEQNPVYRRLIEDGHLTEQDAEIAVTLNTFMIRHRIPWHATIGKGSQNCLDDTADLQFYESIHELAKQMHYENNC